jgi:hypothetical protein
MGKIAHKTLSQKICHKKRAGEMAQGVGPEFKPQYQKKKKKRVSEGVGPGFKPRYHIHTQTARIIL